MTAATTDPTATPPTTGVAAGTGPAVKSQACGAAGRVRLRWTVPRHLRLRTVVVTVNGRRAATLRGNRHRLTVSLPDLPRAEKVVLRATTTGGQRLRASRTFKDCPVGRGRLLRLR
jgi:hypothetical protein